MIKNIFITGKPRSGKSTLLQEVVSGLSKKVGFLTREIRVDMDRVGFELENSIGHKAILAHIDFKNMSQVGKYGVDIKALESILPEISNYSEDDILYIDEIGQMQLVSENFKEIVLKFANSRNIFIATISQIYSHPFIEDLKNRKDAIVIDLSESDIEKQKDFVKAIIGKIGRAKRYMSEPNRFTISNDKAVLKSEHGARHLLLLDTIWKCDCDFFSQHQICSHSMAVVELSMNVA
ncbi:MAG: hypothetical protein NT077_01975 [Candidatus Taylorbacteria bacterium]|nr:hypothetical protein [Candidatus Taylorbacteria bacterium]